jgi:hypothetical protein
LCAIENPNAPTNSVLYFREHKYTKKPRHPPLPPQLEAKRVGYGSRACIVCKIWLKHSLVARSVRDSEDISPVVGKRRATVFTNLIIDQKEIFIIKKILPPHEEEGGWKGLADG